MKHFIIEYRSKIIFSLLQNFKSKRKSSRYKSLFSFYTFNSNQFQLTLLQQLSLYTPKFQIFSSLHKSELFTYSHSYNDQINFGPSKNSSPSKQFPSHQIKIEISPRKHHLVFHYHVPTSYSTNIPILGEEIQPIHNLPDCLPVEDAEEHDPHPSASLHDHLDEFSPFSEVMAQHQTGSFSHEASPGAQHHAVAVTFCNRWIVPVRTIVVLGIAWRFVNREKGRGRVEEYVNPSLWRIGIYGMRVVSSKSANSFLFVARRDVNRWENWTIKVKNKVTSMIRRSKQNSSLE